MPYFTRREILTALKKAILARVKNPLIRAALVYRLNKLLLSKADDNAWVFGNAFSSTEYMNYRFGQTEDIKYLDYVIKGVDYSASTDLVALSNDVMRAEYDRGFMLNSFGVAIKQIFAGRFLGGVDCPVDFVDVWFTLTRLLKQFPLDKHNKQWAAFFDRLQLHTTIRYKRFSSTFLTAAEDAHNGVLYALLKNLDAPKYDPILKVLGMSREFVHVAALLMQRQGYAYGNMDVKKQVSYDMVRVLTRMGNGTQNSKVGKSTQNIQWLNGVFDYPSEAARERMSAAELATIGQFYDYDILQLTQNIATFLSVVVMGGSTQSQKPTPVLASRMTGGLFVASDVEAEIEEITRRVSASISGLGKAPPLLEGFDPEIVFMRAFDDRNLNKSLPNMNQLLRNLVDTTDSAKMAIMKSYMENSSHIWIEDDAHADLFDQIYAFFTQPAPTQAVDENTLVRRQLVEYDKLSSDDMRHIPANQLHAIWRLINSNSTVDPSPSIYTKIRDALDYIYIEQTTDDMAKLPMNELTNRLNFIDDYYPGDSLRERTFTDNFLYAIELKHEADPSFEPFSVL